MRQRCFSFIFITLIGLASGRVVAQANAPKYEVESWLDKPVVGYVEQTDMEPQKFCHGLVESNPTEKFRCLVVQYRDQKYVILNKAEPDARMERDRDESNIGCDEDASAYSNDFWKLYKPFMDFSTSKAERDSAAAELQAFAAQPVSRYERFLAPSACRNARVAASQLLPFSSICRTHPQIAEDHMLDPDWAVRNTATQCIVRWILDRDVASQKRVVDLAFKQLQLIHHTDRNKAIALIAAIASRNAEIAAYVAKNHLAEVEKVARIAKIPNIAEPANRILRAARAAGGTNIEAP